MDVKIFTTNIEPAAFQQVRDIASNPAFEQEQIRIMPDVHAGKGCVVGFTSTFTGKVIPNVVGADIGCGMFVVPLRGYINPFEIDAAIRYFVPSGRNVHRDLSEQHRLFVFNTIRKLHCFDKLKDINYLCNSLGTLGSGNHFIELDEDSKENQYLIIHSGSRNLGKQVADIYQQMAIDHLAGRDTFKQESAELIARLKAEGRHSEIEGALRALREDVAARVPRVPTELCYLDGELAKMYLHDMEICQQFAELNREYIARTILEATGVPAGLLCHGFHTVHNYISMEDKIIRKGAVSAHKDEKLVIPMNMRDGVLLCRGKGNADWNFSAPHGAGRLMSRRQARDLISLDEYQESMKDVFSTSVGEATLDEAPAAYKPMDEIIEFIQGTVEVIDILKPVYNFKASD